MEITWLGHSCFRFKGRDASVVTDPCPPSTGYKVGKLTADIVTISHDHPEHNYRPAITSEAQFVSGPGEYEIAGVLITGVRTRHAKNGDAHGRNVAFAFEIDDIRICHLGDLKQIPHADDVEQLVGADILLVPVGGGPTLDARMAAETVSMLEPKLVIPMRYKTPVSTSDVEGVEQFLKEMGAESKTAESRLTITKSGIPGDTSVVLLEYRG
jgi:L-ascorbate metabolism protein UlaG (beta-lactamase superfamily)